MPSIDYLSDYSKIKADRLEGNFRYVILFLLFLFSLGIRQFGGSGRNPCFFGMDLFDRPRRTMDT